MITVNLFRIPDRNFPSFLTLLLFFLSIDLTCKLFPKMSFLVDVLNFPGHVLLSRPGEQLFRHFNDIFYDFIFQKRKEDVREKVEQYHQKRSI